jgi:hypothetical protein
MTRPLPRCLTPVVVVASVTAFLPLNQPAAGAAVRTEDVSLGPVAARVSYTRNAPYGHWNLRLTISRNSVPIVSNAPVTPPCSKGCDTEPGVDHAGQSRSIAVLDLDHNAEPEVIVNVWSGGFPHCCLWAYVYRYVANESRYELAMHNFAAFGYRLHDPNHDGFVDFVASDYHFAYVFTDFASSRFPIQIWAYREGRFSDETRLFRKLIKRDARDHMHEYKRDRGRGDVRGLLAAYVADRCLLDRCRAGLRFVKRELRRHDVRKYEYPGWPRGRGYLRTLRRFLRRNGYIQ